MQVVHCSGQLDMIGHQAAQLPQAFKAVDLVLALLLDLHHCAAHGSDVIQGGSQLPEACPHPFQVGLNS